MASSNTQTIAFFGATGDCAGYCLAAALKAGYDCIALARTPAKLIASQNAKGVSPQALDSHLTIIEGNVKDVAAVKRTLVCNDKMVDHIVSGIGGTPALQWSYRRPVTLTDTTICQDAGRVILQGATEVSRETKALKKPGFINISTTGISPPEVPRDIPFLYIPFYRWALHVPHVDKAVLEEQLREYVQLPENEKGLSGFVNVKPSLLMDGQGRGLQAIRAGPDEKPAVGYTIQRKDVGDFMFERLVKGEVPSEWRNKSVSIAY
ncbi:Hypothetical predicted protein [Lecanosticta acicola]|uniref:NAD(P)-binding domain-containing protein n=1 Tax=Lecanosticta acicola TaxID=111012 RepID=A0AAI9EAK0_9PEZI|nr:Hypothetical predicted protein [Lecanosticta acicola]